MFLKIKKWLNSAFRAVKSGFKRFPFALSLSIATAILCIIMNRIEDSVSNDIVESISKITLAVAFCIPFSLIIHILIERFTFSKTKKILLYSAIPIVGLLVRLFLVNELEATNILKYGVLSGTLYILTIILAHYKGKTFELFNVNILKRFLVTYIYALILFGGLSGIFAMIDLLFEINIDEKIYLDLFILSMLVFGPLYFLGKIPKVDKELPISDYPIVFKVLLLYIVMPIICIYTTILYVYLIKSVFTTLPDGIIGNLIIWYSISTTFVVFLVRPFKEENKFVAFFERWLPKAQIPLMALLFVSIFIRISDYGVTLSRYYVVLCGLFILATSIFLGFFKNIKTYLIPSLLCTLAIVSIFGPLSSFNVSSRSQNNRLINILEDNDMIDDNGMVIANSKLNQEDIEEISSIIRYMDRNHDLEKLSVLPKNYQSEDFEKTFGFKTDYYSFKDSYKGFNLFSPDTRPVALKKYDYFVDYSNYYDNGNVIKEIDDYTFEIEDKRYFSISKSNKEELTIDLFPIIKKLYDENDNGDYRLELDDSSVVFETDKYNLLIVFTEINGEFNSKNEIKEIYNLGAMIFVDAK